MADWMSSGAQGPPVPVRYTFTPAAAVSARPFVPQGVEAPSGGPGESTSGNVAFPLNRNVRERLYDVSAALAAPARDATMALAASRTTSVFPMRLPTDDRFFPPEASPGAYPGIREVAVDLYGMLTASCTTRNTA